MQKFWSVSDLATALGVSTSWVYDRTRRDGPELIPHFKMGKYVRFNPSSESFRSWLSSHETKSGGQEHIGALYSTGLKRQSELL